MKQIIIFLLAAFLLSTSCMSELDTDQIEQFNFQPVFEADILYFDIAPTNLIDKDGLFRAVVRDTVDLDIFEDGNVRDAFIKAEISVAYKNTFYRQFDTNFYFVDNNNYLVDYGNFFIPAATPSDPEVSGEAVFIFDIYNNPDFVNFRKIIIEVTVSPDDLPVEEGGLHVQSKGTFYTNITAQ